MKRGNLIIRWWWWQHSKDKIKYCQKQPDLLIQMIFNFNHHHHLLSNDISCFLINATTQLIMMIIEFWSNFFFNEWMNEWMHNHFSRIKLWTTLFFRLIKKSIHPLIKWYCKINTFCCCCFWHHFHSLNCFSDQPKKKKINLSSFVVKDNHSYHIWWSTFQ